MRSEAELREASGYADRPRDFADLIHILDPELRLITPTEPEVVESASPVALAPGGLGALMQPRSPHRYHQLTHDYLVPSLRDWLTRKQRETRRGRAELWLAERASLWNAKPENRHLPSVLEWANIRVLTKKRSWTEPERRMMKRAGRIHGLHALGAAAALFIAVVIGLDIRRRVILANQQTVAAGLVDQVVRVNIAQVPEIVRSMAKYRRFVDPALREIVSRSPQGSTERLHASLALLPVDSGQVDDLYDRLREADADALPVLRGALEPHAARLTPRLWPVLESSQPGDPRLLPAASALALYDPQDARWAKVGGSAALAMVRVNAIYLRSWLDALRPVREKLTAPLAAIFRDQERSDSEHTQATSILADYAAADPSLIADLLMDADPKAYGAFFSIAQGPAESTLPLFQAEIAKKATFSWSDAPLDPSWTKPDDALVDRIEAAGGLLMERFAFCQTMVLEEFLTTAEGLRKSGYRPTRLRPCADGPVITVAAVWTRDGRDWRIASGLTVEEIRQRDEEMHRGSVGRGSPPASPLVGEGGPEGRMGGRVGRGSPDPARSSVGRESPDPAPAADRRSPDAASTPGAGRPSVPQRAGSGDPRPTSPGDVRPTSSADSATRKGAPYLPVDVAGYVATGSDGKPADRYAALWAEQAGPDDDGRMFVAVPAGEVQKAQDQLKSAGMAPATLLAFRDSNQRTSFCGTGRKSATYTASIYDDVLGERNVPDELAQHAAINLLDVSVSAAEPPLGTKERASVALKKAEATLKAKPDDQSAAFSRASADFQLGEYAKAIDALSALIKKAPQLASAFSLRAIAHARLGHKAEASADLALYEKSASDQSTKLYLSVIVAAELGEGTEQAFEKLEAALKGQPGHAGLHYDAACAIALASQALAKEGEARRRALADRAIALLKQAIENGYSDFSHMQEDADLDPIRGLPAFGEIMLAGRLDRSYSAVWDGAFRFEPIALFGLDPAAHLERCRELAAQGNRMVSLSVARISPGAPPVTASVWHRPVINEPAKDHLAERQARAAIALIRMGKADEVWPLLRHSADPRVRSFIINRLNPLGADAGIVATELARIESVGRGSPDPARIADRGSPSSKTVAQPGRPSVAPVARSGDLATTGGSSAPSTLHAPPSTQRMDTILFHPETSIRRALILALGTYGPSTLSPGEREPMTAKLLALFKNDPDAGIHAATEWTLRQWHEQAKLQSAESKLPNLKDRGDRRWFTNSQGPDVRPGRRPRRIHDGLAAD